MLDEKIIAREVKKGIISAGIDSFAIGIIFYGIWIFLSDSNIAERFQNKFSKKNKYTTTGKKEE